MILWIFGKYSPKLHDDIPEDWNVELRVVSSKTSSSSCPQIEMLIRAKNVWNRNLYITRKDAFDVLYASPKAVSISKWHKGKGKGHPRTGHEDAERGGGRGETIIFLTSALDGGGWSAPRPDALTPRKRSGTHCTGGWGFPWAGLNGRGKSRLHRDSIPLPSSQ